MAGQNCRSLLDQWIKLVSYKRSFFLGFCVLNFVFSLVATLGNLLVHSCLNEELNDTSYRQEAAVKSGFL